ncbi:hypothetical protein [Sphingopyxis sp. PET50]|uniref:hypothetical protein n=1 Tax=Sphingopyxis sp. PET50 TaxID=2976533 RepID=UPI0021AE8B2C|nr:hypothetical protein [Sphingopyxis sp. PET50]
MLLSIDSDAIVKVQGANRPDVQRALDGLTLISMVNDEAPGKAIRARCSDKCKITGTIEQIERNAWWFKKVTAVEALPDGFDFMDLSDGGGPPDQKLKGPNGEMPRDVGAADPLRKTLLDALRPAIEADLGQPVQFVVRKLRKQNEWAFAHVMPQTKAGTPVDYSGTRYAEALREGMFDDGDIFALLENKKGAWTVRDFVVGPTDVAYAGWPEQYGAPYPLFELPVP